MQTVSFLCLFNEMFIFYYYTNSNEHYNKSKTIVCEFVLNVPKNVITVRNITSMNMFLIQLYYSE